MRVSGGRPARGPAAAAAPADLGAAQRLRWRSAPPAVHACPSCSSDGGALGPHCDVRPALRRRLWVRPAAAAGAGVARAARDGELPLPHSAVHSHCVMQHAPPAWCSCAPAQTSATRTQVTAASGASNLLLSKHALLAAAVRSNLLTAHATHTTHTNRSPPRAQASSSAARCASSCQRPSRRCTPPRRRQRPPAAAAACRSGRRASRCSGAFG